MIRIVQLCCDPDLLALNALRVAEDLVEGPTNLFMVSVRISAINVPVSHFQSMLYGLLDLVCTKRGKLSTVT